MEDTHLTSIPVRASVTSGGMVREGGLEGQSLPWFGLRFTWGIQREHIMRGTSETFKSSDQISVSDEQYFQSVIQASEIESYPGSKRYARSFSAIQSQLEVVEVALSTSPSSGGDKC